ncbi:TRAP transporter TatT component family protein [Trichloromonas sp.]|uniref:TRAP transporter TatT component family protein n=1 Tax=Trichloromonas sp. TaxID=3069249 RepID=UPI003D819457
MSCRFAARPLPLCFLLVLLLLSLSGCVSRLSDGMARSVLNNPDPDTVRLGIPAYLLLLDGLIQDDPDDEALLVSASSLHALGSALEPEGAPHRLRLAERAWQYGVRAVCARDGNRCGSWDKSFTEFTAGLGTLEKADVPAYYAFGVGWMARLQADGERFQVLAELSRVEALFARLVELDEGFQQGGPQLYLGILRLLRPPSLGGDPERGRAHLERVIVLSAGRNLEARVELARRYARMLYDRELHDRLLREVLAADPAAEGLTLFNVLAQEEALRLLESADDYFP